MANEIFKEIKTKIALKTLSYAEWDAIKDTYKPLKGEVCVCTIPEGNAAATTAPTVMFKVGDGTNFFGALKWASALAADVYGWAKENALFIHKDGTGNVVSGVEWDASLNGGKGGVKYTTAAVATAEGLKDLQDAVAAIEKDITDNRDAWVLDTDTRYSFSTDGDKLVVKKTLYTNGVAGAEEAVGTYEFLTAGEVAETLKGYYTKGEADGKFVTGLAEGTTNGTVKAVVNGVSGDDIKVHGLESAAYVTVDSLNATAKGYADAVEAKLPTSANYGVLEVKGDDASGVVVDNTDAQRPIVKIAINTYDAHGAAAGVQSNLTAYETAHKDDYTNTKIDELVQGAKDYADNNDANTEYHVEYDSTNKKIKLVAGADASKMEIDATDFIKDGMIDTVTIGEDNDLVITFNTAAGKDEIRLPLDQLVDIYTGSTGTEVNVAVSNQNVISASLNSEIATKIAHGEEAYNWGNHAGAGYAKTADLGDLAAKDKIVEGDIDGTIGVGKINGLGALATKDNITHDLVTDFNAAVKAVKVDNAANADKAADADKLGGELPAYYATKASVDAIPGAIDDKIAAYDASKKFGDIITHNAAEFATNAENGAKALADANKLAIDAINDVDTGILAAAKKDSADKVAVALSESQKYTDEKVGGLHAIATSGSIYDVEEHSVDENGVVYLLLDCNW